eukprot:5760294-Amphidinium_carterae.1
MPYGGCWYDLSAQRVFRLAEGIETSLRCCLESDLQSSVCQFAPLKCAIHRRTPTVAADSKQSAMASYSVTLRHGSYTARAARLSSEVQFRAVGGYYRFKFRG